MARQAVKVTGNRVIKAWKEYYEEFTDSTFRPTYPMIKMAEKLGEFYTMPELLQAMQFYFSRGKSNIYDFLSTIDKVFEAMDEDRRSQVRVATLEEETTKLVKKIHRLKPGGSD